MHADTPSRRLRLLATLSLAALLAAAAPACAPVTEDVPGGDGENVAEIVNGTEARNHPEACVISFNGSICTGALVAPNVVLTAGHCVHGATSWRVTCPYSSDPVTVTASQGSVPSNYPNLHDPDADTIDNSRGSDLGLIRLDRPLRETRVGRVRLSGVATGSRVYAYGRINNGTATSRVYQSPLVTLTAHDRANGFWVAVDRTVIQAGDSGGPLQDANTGEIVAVNSAGVDAAACRRGAVCDLWAVVGAASSWFNTTLQRYTAAAPAPPPDACNSSTDCAACTARSSCGWCNGRCVTGTSAGGAACTAAAGNWAWTSNQCAAPTPPPQPADPCNSSTTCSACTARSSCGWCNGRCVTGTSSGGGACTTTARNWYWLSSQCR